MAPELAILILAAGGATRMGNPKQLLPFGESHLLNKVIANATTAAGGNLFCVLGANFEVIKQSIDQQHVTLIFNQKWEEGLGGSIAKGVEFLQRNNPEYKAILIILADQPLVDSVYLKKMIALRERFPAQVIASGYGSFLGVPALFPQGYFNELTVLKGDAGAKKLLNETLQNVIPIKAKEKLTDIDTPEDYKKMLKSIKS